MTPNEVRATVFKDMIKELTEFFEARIAGRTDCSSKRIIFNDDVFSVSCYCVKSGAKINLWANSGRVSLGHKLVVEATEDKSVVQVATDLAVNRFNDWLNGFVRCCDCGKLITREDVAGSYFAGVYCTDCWEGKWKAIEANETYD